MGKLYLSLLLSLAVFLLFHDLAVFALNLSPADLASGSHGGPGSSRSKRSAPACEDWEVAHGSDCVCATKATARCHGQGGMVCDTSGKHYASPCDFSLAICNGDTSVDQLPTSCGYCDDLRLVVDTTTVATFRKVHSSASVPTYQSTGSDHALLFYSTQLKAWAIGYKNHSGEFVSRMQFKGTKYPQDSREGLLLARLNGTRVVWEHDPMLRFECTKGPATVSRKKFIFALIAAIVAATTVTTTTLHVVQAAKGCLYYPSVCHMRDEIEHHLKPEVKNLRDSFIKKYGSPRSYKSVVESMQHNLLDIRDHLVQIEKLHITMNHSVSEIDKVLGLLQNDFPDFTHVLDSYNKYADSLALQAGISVIGSEVELISIAASLGSMTAATVSSFALAASIIGSVFAIGFAIVDVVQSVTQERKVRDELQHAKNRLLQAKANIIKANHNMESVQKKICHSVINFFYTLSSRGAKYHSYFRNLQSFLSKTYFSSSHNCDRRDVYDGSTYTNLRTLNDRHLHGIELYTRVSLHSLQTKVNEVKTTDAFFNRIKSLLTAKRTSPTKIFQDVHKNRPTLARDAFATFFSLLKYAAKEVFPHTVCFWGYNLDHIRRGKLTDKNLHDMTVCKSPEIQSTVNSITNSVSRNEAPCKILRQIKGDLFNSITRVVRFIASQVSTHSYCYWGYDLSRLRAGTFPRDVGSAKLTSSMFQVVKLLSRESDARHILCSKNHICDATWQTLLLCEIWHGTSKTQHLHCARHAHLQCVPSNLAVENCS